MSGRVIIFEGIDNTGKTTIAKALAHETLIPYFKNPREKQAVLNGEFDIESRNGVMLMDFLKMTGHPVIMDRNYASEYAYGKGLRDKCDDESIRRFDDTYSEIGTLIVYCSKENHVPNDDWLRNDQAQEVIRWYEDFLSWTKCWVLRLDTSDEDIFRQLRTIRHFLSRLPEGNVSRATYEARYGVGVGDTRGIVAR